MWVNLFKTTEKNENIHHCYRYCPIFKKRYGRNFQKKAILCCAIERKHAHAETKKFIDRNKFMFSIVSDSVANGIFAFCQPTNPPGTLNRPEQGTIKSMGSNEKEFLVMKNSWPKNLRNSHISTFGLKESIVQTTKAISV
jgi:hypothetical protein